MKLAVSAEDSLFRQNRVLDESWAKNYPGASWLPLVKKYLGSAFEVVTADVALDHVVHGFWNAQDILVIQHGQDVIAKKLIHEGALPLALTCFESPLYIGGFYHNISNLAPIFKNRILFSGLYERFSTEFGVNHQVTFPSYFLNDLSMKEIPWEQRNFMVAVIGNKYNVPSCCPSIHRPLEWFWWLRNKLSQFLHHPFSSDEFPAKDIQLQDLRLEAISFFMSKGLLDLYGKGWDALRNLPPRWQNRMSAVLKSHDAKECNNKLETIKNYKFGLCIENAEFPGYLTEKIFDCLVAKIIPIYIGAPDIERYISKSCFLDMRDYKSMDELKSYLQSMPESSANEMIACGQEFLQSESGQRYSYEGFAEFIANIVKMESEVKQ